MENYKITIIQDEYAESPREWSNLGRMGCLHNRYSLGNKEYSSLLNTLDPGISWDDTESQLKKYQEEYGDPILVILPLSLYDHSGLAMSVGRSSGWDSGVVGFIWATKKDIQEMFGVKRISKKLLAQVEQSLKNEVDVYSKYLSGDVYEYLIEGDDNKFIESCGGFYGYNECEKEAESIVEYLKERNVKETIKMIDSFILDGSTRRTAC